VLLSHHAHGLESYGFARIGGRAHQELCGDVTLDARGHDHHVTPGRNRTARVGLGNLPGVRCQRGRGKRLHGFRRGLAHGLRHVGQPSDQRPDPALEAQPPDGIDHRGPHRPIGIVERRQQDTRSAVRAQIARRAGGQRTDLKRRVIHEGHNRVDQSRAPELQQLEVGVARHSRVGRRHLLDDAIQIAHALERQRGTAPYLVLRIAQRSHQRRGVLQLDVLEGLQGAQPSDVIGIGERRDQDVDRAFGFDTRNGARRLGTHLGSWIAQRGLDEGLEGTTVLDLPERSGGGDAQQVVSRVQQRDQRLDGVRRPHVAENTRRPYPSRRVRLVDEQAEELGDGDFSEADERLGDGSRRALVDLVELADQERHRAGVAELGEGLGRCGLHRPVLVGIAQGKDERWNRLGAARPAEHLRCVRPLRPGARLAQTRSVPFDQPQLTKELQPEGTARLVTQELLDGPLDGQEVEGLP